MKNLVKRISVIAVALVALTVTTASAQVKGQSAVGGGLVFNTDDGPTVGLNFKYQYNITNPLRLEPSFTYFFKDNNVSLWDISVNLHYLFDVGSDFVLYPLAGFGIYGVNVSGGGSDTDFGLNLGGGVDYHFDSNWFANFQIKFAIKDGSTALIGLGVGYKF